MNLKNNFIILCLVAKNQCEVAVTAAEAYCRNASHTSSEGEITCTEVGLSHTLASGTCIPAHRIRFSDFSSLIVNN